MFLKSRSTTTRGSPNATFIGSPLSEETTKPNVCAPLIRTLTLHGEEPSLATVLATTRLPAETSTSIEPLLKPCAELGSTPTRVRKNLYGPASAKVTRSGLGPGASIVTPCGSLRPSTLVTPRLAAPAVICNLSTNVVTDVVGVGPAEGVAAPACLSSEDGCPPDVPSCWRMTPIIATMTPIAAIVYPVFHFQLENTREYYATSLAVTPSSLASRVKATNIKCSWGLLRPASTISLRSGAAARCDYRPYG
jgi:hypothetical protein